MQAEAGARNEDPAEESGDEVFAAIGEPLLQMTLGNQQKTRVLAGCIEHTVLLPRGHRITKLMEEAGAAWTKCLEKHKSNMQAGEAAMDEDELGPPHVAKGMAMLDGLCQHDFPEEFKAIHRALQQYKADIESGPLQDAMSCVRQAWNTQCYTKEGQKPLDRLVYTFEGTLMIQRADSSWRPVPVNQAIDILLRHLGATQKGGPPPPLQAERKLKKLMTAFFKK